MDEVRQMLEGLKLADKYAGKFEEEGYDDLAEIRTMNDADFDGLVQDVGMKKGHRRTLHRFLKNLAPASPEAPPAAPPAAPLAPPRLVDKSEGATAGGGESDAVVNLTGTWVLDTTRSDRVDAYLSAMGLSETAIERAAKAEQEHPTINIIAQTADTYTITRRSRMIDATKTFKIGQETTEVLGVVTTEVAKSGNKNKKVLVTADTTCVRTVTSMPLDRQLIDTRTIQNNGAVMTLSVELLTPTAKVSLMRYFDRQAPKPTEQPPSNQAPPVVPILPPKT
jgi:hypothetical protein